MTAFPFFCAWQREVLTLSRQSSNCSKDFPDSEGSFSKAMTPIEAVIRISVLAVLIVVEEISLLISSAMILAARCEVFGSSMRWVAGPSVTKKSWGLR